MSEMFRAVGTRIAYHCPECDTTWLTDDDANEWAYGHDCEGE